MTMKFSRVKLYNEIWEISAKQVANRYRLKYSSLLKKCKEYSIPLPDGKYWYFKSNKRDISNLIAKLPLSNVVEIEIEIPGILCLSLKFLTILSDFSSKSDK